MDLEQYKSVIKKAIDSEINARKFYLDVASRIKKPYLKELFEKFASEERKHETILTGILKKDEIQTGYFSASKDFKISESVEMPEVKADMDLKSAIALAMKNEEIAMKTYSSLADNCEDQSLKAVFLDLASMERDHKFKMEQNFVDVAYPEVW